MLWAGRSRYVVLTLGLVLILSTFGTYAIGANCGSSASDTTF